ncbi:polysaccharide pyruvyl transferase family protein [Pseudomonadales bacterium]|nr:polysaccharide pyruvyl transferase family protein [Pseudomonadales bacterium]
MGILTFHDSVNHGAFYQVFAMQIFLESLGLDAYVLNYTNKHHKQESLKTLFSSKNPLTLIRSLLKMLAFRSAQKELRLIPKNLICSHSELTRISSKMEFIIFGSDIIWDFTLPQLGHDTAYFGDGLCPSSGKVAYAASMGTSNTEFPEDLIQLISTFKSIGVRDDRTFDRIKHKIHGQNSLVKVLDPTLLITPEFWNKMVPSPKNRRPYILVYAFYIPSVVKDWISEFSERLDLDIIVVGYKNGVNGANHCHAGPEDWLELIRGADFVVTSTFHGTIFSTIYRKQFICIGNDAIDGKVISLLGDLGMLDDVYWHDKLAISVLEKLLVRKIDYDQAFRKLTVLRDHSAHFLTDAIIVESKDQA